MIIETSEVEVTVPLSPCVALVCRHVIHYVTIKEVPEGCQRPAVTRLLNGKETEADVTETCTCMACAVWSECAY